ncbi:SIMPL domain-containing protein, partial [Candidatus Hakubella thermalkaliphila]|uniref:SIMPL domain-containing protein n=1 Tax=Candidatus Hakubella thermalkaliphila TaxID=2754717 RepID=UPI00387EC292
MENHYFTSKVSDLIAKATKAGATSIYGVRFDVSPGNKAEMEALNDAYANAKTKAEALAAAMGVRLKEIYSARENG